MIAVEYAQLAFYISTVLVCLACLSYSIVQNRFDILQHKIYVWMIAEILISAFSGIMISLHTELAKTNYAVYILSYVFHEVFLVFHFILAATYFYYVITVTGAARRRMNFRYRFRIFAIPAILGELVILLNPINDFVFTFTQQQEFTRNIGDLFLYLLAVFFMCSAMIYMIFYRKAMASNKRLALTAFYILVFVGGTIQYIHQDFKIELVAEAVALVGLMTAVENEDEKMDVETGTYNRHGLLLELRNAFEIKQNARIICVRIVDLDNYQKITGSAYTDNLVSNIGAFFGTLVKRNLIFRTTPANFILIMPEATMEEANEVIAKIEERFAQYWSTSDAQQILLHVRIIETTMPDTMKNADDVLYMADAPIPDSITDSVVHDDKLDYIMRHVDIIRALQIALEDHNFEIYYQPIYEVGGLNINAAEALSRLHDPAMGDIAPNEFIPIAEHNGYIEEIGESVITTVCEFIHSGIPQEMGLSYISINLSIVQCMNPKFLLFVRDTIKKYQVDPSYICFDISESAAASDMDMLMKVVTSLKFMGFKLALDDYGTGSSNMYSVFALGFDMIKFDRSILWESEKNADGRIVMESSIRMVHEMKRRVIVSGVETAQQIDWISRLEVDYIQGFYFSKPVTQNELIGILRATQLARAEERRARAESEAKTNFLANMSHEIRTPINAVLGMDEMILRESDDERIVEYAQNIEGAGRSLLSLINDILDFSKLESGSMEIVSDEYDVSSVVNDVINMINIKAKEKGLKFNVSVDSQMPERLYGDEMRIRQIMVNLLNNAIKYTREGSVSLELSADDYSVDKIALKISVIDTGIGIKKDDLGKLFRKFQRVDMDQNKSIEGSGLGLAITKNLLNLMDGRIEVDSTYNVGSTFTAYIPQKVINAEPIGDFRARYQEYSKEKPEYHESFHARNVHILSVDDTPMNHMVVKGLLKNTGIRITTANSGEEALLLASQTKYDCILLDYRMPEMDGTQTLHNLRAINDSPNKHTPVIALTANAIKGSREKFLADGFDDYLTKPIDSALLESMLIRHLPPSKVALEKKSSKARSDVSEELIPEEEFATVLDKESTPTAEQTSNNEQYRKSWNMHTNEPEETVAVEPADKVNELNIEKGLSNCGSEDAFKEVLKIYYESIEENAAQIEAECANKDYKNYTIHVHALKSTSRIIGAEKLGDMAYMLEQAGDQENTKFIDANTPKLLSVYRSFKEKIENCGYLEISSDDHEEDAADKEPLTDDVKLDAITTIKEFASSLDYDDSMAVLDQIYSYQLSDEDQQFFDTCKDMISHFKWDEVIEFLNK